MMGAPYHQWIIKGCISIVPVWSLKNDEKSQLIHPHSDSYVVLVQTPSYLTKSPSATGAFYLEILVCLKSHRG